MTKLGAELLESLSEALAHAEGAHAEGAHAEGRPSGVRTTTFEVPDVRGIQRKLHMSQQAFADAYRIPLPTLKNWEQGRRHPDAPAAA